MITAAAHLVMSIVDGVWTTQEWGERDVAGARVGALLQVLFAREPSDRAQLFEAGCRQGPMRALAKSR